MDFPDHMLQFNNNFFSILSIYSRVYIRLAALYRRCCRVEVVSISSSGLRKLPAFLPSTLISKNRLPSTQGTFESD